MTKVLEMFSVNNRRSGPSDLSSKKATSEFLIMFEITFICSPFLIFPAFCLLVLLGSVNDIIFDK
jgi:hypothetical protein